MKVTLLTRKDFAGAGQRIVEALKDVIDIDIISLQQSNFELKGVKSLNQYGITKAIQRVNDSDILHWIGDDPPADNFFGKFKIPFKKVVFSAGGTRFRRKGFSGWATWNLCEYIADFKGCITHELAYNDVQWCPHVWSDFDYKWKRQDKFRIVHIPSTPEVKGSKIIQEGINLLKKKRSDFKYIYTTNIPYAESLEIKKTASIYIDQVILPHYAMAGVESMAFGIPTMANVIDLPIEHPLLTANTPETIAEALDKAMNWETLEELSKRTFKYCKSIHGRGGEMWHNIYKKALSENNNTIYVLIPAYKTQNYINECLKGFEKQTNKDFKVIVGIDGDSELRSSIKVNFPELQIVEYKENRGCYAVLNDLLDYVPFKNRFIFFGSDDIPYHNLISEIYEYKVPILQFKYKENGITQFSSSARMIQKQVIEYYGKYKDWRCGGDTEMMRRLRNICTIKTINSALFSRTIRKDSLTQCKEYGFNSEYRKKIANEINSSTSNMEK